MVISDLDPKLTSKLWQKSSNTLKIQRNLATACHRQTNGQVERTTRTVKQMLITDMWLEFLSTFGGYGFTFNCCLNDSSLCCLDISLTHQQFHLQKQSIEK